MGIFENVTNYFRTRRAIRNAAGTAEKTAPSSSEEDALFEAQIRGIPLTRDMALSIPKVSSCVSRITDTIASVPFRLYRQKEEDGRVINEEIIDDPRLTLINSDPGDTLTAYEFKKILITDYLLGRGGYAYINRAGNAILSLHHIDDKLVTPMKNTDPIFKAYTLQINGKIYDDYQIFRVLRSTADGSSGKSLIKEISKAVETAFSALCYELHVTQTGGVKKGFLQAPGTLTEAVKKDIKAAWRRLYSSESSENVVLLSNGITFQEANQTPLDLQLDKIRADMNNDIQEAFGVVDDDEKFLNRTIQPILTALENAMNVFLLLEKEKGTLFFQADTRRLRKFNGAAVLSINEARYRENLPTVPGLDIIPLSLGNTFADAKTGKIIVPNTGETIDPEGDNNDGNEGGEE